MVSVKRIPPVPAETRYAFELSESEAKALHTVLRCVGGDPVDTPRGQVQALCDGLAMAGVDHFPDNRTTGSVYFKAGL